MNKFLFYIIFSIISLAAVGQTKGHVDRTTKEFHLIGNISDNYTIYGYALPDFKSEKVIKFSLSTIKPKKEYYYKLGSYHETTGLHKGDRIKYIGRKGKFAEMQFISADNKITTFYIRRKNVDAN